MTVLGLRLARRANAVSALHGEVSRAMWKGLDSGQNGRQPCPSATSPTACTCRRGWRRRCFACTTAIWARGWHEHSSEARIWEGIENVDDGELWETHLSLKSRLLEFVRRRAVEQAERRGEPPENVCSAWAGAQSGRADDRICAPLRHVQAGQSDSGRHRKTGVDGERPETPGAIRFRRQGSSARRAGQASVAADRAADARRAIRRQVCFRRGLRHQRRAAFRAGRGRLAEQPAAAARGVRAPADRKWC